MQKYEIVSLFDGYAVRKEHVPTTFLWLWKSGDPYIVNYFHIPRTDGFEYLDLGHTWSSCSPELVKKYCISKTLEEAEELVERLKTNSQNCLNARVVKTV